MRFSTQYTLHTACIAVTALLAGCNNTLDFRNAEISNNKIYSHGSNTGFSGKVTNIPLTELPAGKVAQLIKVAGTVTKDTTLTQLISAYTIAGALGKGENGILCDVAVSDGILDGDAVCNATQAAVPLFNLPFKNGSLSGTVTIFDPKHKGIKIAEAAYTRGELNGRSKVFSASNGKTIHTAAWVNGVANGPEEAFDAETGKRIMSATLKDGQYNGEMSSFSADGKLIDTKIWKDGVVLTTTPDAAALTSNLDACVVQWATAYHKEKGEDAAVAADQMAEWEDWCRQGKKPITP